MSGPTRCRPRPVDISDDPRCWAPLAPRIYTRRSRPTGTSEPLAVVPRNRVLVGDAATRLRQLPTGIIDAVVTSPPYFLLRDYGVAGQLGAEPHIDDYVTDFVAVADEIARVLKPTGSFWLNLGDSYSRGPQYGAPAKGMLLAPERILLALHARGWIVRNKIVWSKPNAMPTSVRDRLACSWEPLYLLVRSEHYRFDLDAIREPHRSSRTPARRAHQEKYANRPDWAGPLAGANDGLIRARAEGRVGHPLGKNPGDVWTIATAGYRGAHFATFPPRLVERPFLAAVPERICTTCSRPWKRDALHLVADCGCSADWRPGIVLDPFMGAGTVAVTAERHRRDWLGIELNPDYAQLATQRIENERAKRARDGPIGKRRRAA